MKDKRAYSLWITALTDDILRNEISEIKLDPSNGTQSRIISSSVAGLSEDDDYYTGYSAESQIGRHYSIGETFVDESVRNHFSVRGIRDKTTAHKICTNSLIRIPRIYSDDAVAVEGNISASSVSHGKSEGVLHCPDVQSTKALMVEKTLLPELIIDEDTSPSEEACITNDHDDLHSSIESVPPPQTMSQMESGTASTHPIIAVPYQRKVLPECAAEVTVDVSGLWSGGSRQHEDLLEQLERETESYSRVLPRGTSSDIVTRNTVVTDRTHKLGIQRGGNTVQTQNASKEVAAKRSVLRNIPRYGGEHEGSVDLSSLTFQVK